MAHRINATFSMLLSDNPNEMATSLAEVAKAWTTFVDSLDQYQAEMSFTVGDIRTSTPLYKRGKKNAVSRAAAGRPVAVPDAPEAA
jgi:hypothetical protein